MVMVSERTLYLYINFFTSQYLFHTYFAWTKPNTGIIYRALVESGPNFCMFPVLDSVRFGHTLNSLQSLFCSWVVLFNANLLSAVVWQVQYWS